MLDLKRVRPLDAAIVAAIIVVVVLGGFLGVSWWMNRSQMVAATPATRAVKQLTAAVRANPNNIDLRMRLAQALAVAGRDRDAVDQYKASLELKKDYVPALSGLGFIALKQKQFTQSEKYYRKIIDQLQGNVPVGGESSLETAHFYLGTTLMEQKKYEEAASHFKEALRLRRDASDTHYQLAVCYREMGMDDAYEESLGNALLFDPKMPEPNYYYGLILQKKGDLAAAAEHFRTSATSAPSKKEPQEALASLGTAEERIAAAKKLKESDAAKALVQARIALALDPTSIEAQLLAASLYEATGDAQKAIEGYQKILISEPDNAAAKSGLERVKNGS